MTKRTARINAALIKNTQPELKPFRLWDTELKNFLIRVQPTGSMSYYFHYQASDGKFKFLNLGKVSQVTPMQARDIAREKAGEVARGIDVHAQKMKQRKEAKNEKLRTLGGFIREKFAPWYVVNTKTGATTLRSIQRQFGHLMNTPMSEISQWSITKWKTEQKKKGKAVASINRELASLSGVLSRAVEWKVIDTNPLKGMKQDKVDNQRVRYLNHDENNRLYAALIERQEELKAGRDSGNEWRKARGKKLFPVLAGVFADHLMPMVFLSLNTGMRRKELFTLIWERVNFDRRVLTCIEKSKEMDKKRHINLNKLAWNTLQDWQHSSDKKTGLVFPSRNGKPFDNVNTAFGNLLKMAGIEDFHWHDMRHTFASNLVMAGVDLNTVRELMGHSDIKMTLRYAHLAPEHKAAAVEKIGQQETNITPISSAIIL